MATTVIKQSNTIVRVLDSGILRLTVANNGTLGTTEI